MVMLILEQARGRPICSF